MRFYIIKTGRRRHVHEVKLLSCSCNTGLDSPTNRVSSRMRVRIFPRAPPFVLQSSPKELSQNQVSTKGSFVSCNNFDNYISLSIEKPERTQDQYVVEVKGPGLVQPRQPR